MVLGIVIHMIVALAFGVACGIHLSWLQIFFVFLFFEIIHLYSKNRNKELYDLMSFLFFLWVGPIIVIRFGPAFVAWSQYLFIEITKGLF